MAEFGTLERQERFRWPPQSQLAHPRLDEVAWPHTHSFNELFEHSRLLNWAARDIGKVQAVHNTNGSVIRFWISDVQLAKPTLSTKERQSANRKILPSECRERLATYRGRLVLKLNYQVNDGPEMSVMREAGMLPIMVRSNRCHLESLNAAQLVTAKEESTEFGGFFIVNGNEKLIRMLIVAKRNHPLAIVRPSFANRGSQYTPLGVQIRCVRFDHSACTNTLHYLQSGSIMLRFSWRKNEYLVPLIMVLKALKTTCDKEIFEGIVRTKEDLENTFLTERVELMLREYRKLYGSIGLSRLEILKYLGSKFRVALSRSVDDTFSDEQVGQFLIDKVILVHLTDSIPHSISHSTIASNGRSLSNSVSHSTIASNGRSLSNSISHSTIASNGRSNTGNDSSLPNSKDNGGFSREVKKEKKFRLLLMMARKLYALASGECCADNPDSPQNQELLLGGFLYGQIIKEKMEDYLYLLRAQISADQRRSASQVDFHNDKYIQKLLGKCHDDIGSKLLYFLSTGNIVSSTGLDLQQTSGYTIIAEKINFYRFISHFRMVHRGSFFAELKTTTVRKLLPESWGFLCPVHTPDGSPCGLLNHLAHEARVVTRQPNTESLTATLVALGMSSPQSDQRFLVLVDGDVVGAVSDIEQFVERLRFLKVRGKLNVPSSLEIGFVPEQKGGQYPGLYLFSNPSRLIRPVTNLGLKATEWISPFEQVYLDIKVKPTENWVKKPSHMELSPLSMLSIVANMTPFSDYNQSPRNMYQCQMGKQTMGTPGTAIRHRTDNKLYRIMTPQTPIVRPKLHKTYGLDDFPNGTNAVVAVLSYTGYDMEDAMIINKSAQERGFGYGVIYKSESVDLSRYQRRGEKIVHHFGFAPGTRPPSKWLETLDLDGLPLIGARLEHGSALCAFYDSSTGKNSVELYKSSEEAFVEEVRVIGSDLGDSECQLVQIKLRIPRSPNIGDKFSSRHGQKGVCSQKYASINMPFTESGIQPDVIINPHAFPSRMTIGMFVESLAGKLGALEGRPQDCKPFSDEFKSDSVSDYFGEHLAKHGFNYFGNEPMYSGITGEEFKADIYIGVVYYQRLRHMVNDKFQVRTTGPVHALTKQPVKGRKRAGGIRFGEMERDAVIAHGSAFLLQDRLMNCSDYSRNYVCRDCGSLLSTQSVQTSVASGSFGDADSPSSTLATTTPTTTSSVRCRVCARPDSADGIDAWQDVSGTTFSGGGNTALVAIPSVLLYLASELLSMNIRLELKVF